MYNCTTIKKTKITFCLMQFCSHTIFILKDLNFLLILFISLSVLLKWIYPKEDSRLFQIVYCFRDFDRKGGKLKKKNHKAYLNIYLKAIYMIFCDHVCLFSGIASLSWKAVGFLEGTDRTGFYKLTYEALYQINRTISSWCLQISLWYVCNQRIKQHRG